MAKSNKYYDKLIKELDSKKDSIFEPCRVNSFNASKFTATVYGMRSNQVKENVLVLFPSLFLNSGIVSFPVKNSTGILFIGADNENYLFPAQFLPPTREVTNGVNENNAAPGQYDEILSLEHLEAGEHLIRALSGSYIFVRNSGEIELATSKLHRIALNELDGSLETAVEKERKSVGNFNYYNGPYEQIEANDDKNLNKHHIVMSFTEDVPKWESDEILTQQDLQRILELGDMDIFAADTDTTKTFEFQMSNVFSKADASPIKSSIDEDNLFLDAQLMKEGQTRFHANLSKSGALELTSQSETGESSARIEFSEKKIGMALEQNQNRYTMELGDEGVRVKAEGTGSAELVLSPTGDMQVALDGETHSFKALLERVNQLSLLNKLEPL